MPNPLTKNDEAWLLLFERYGILNAIEQNGFYEITAKTINTVRESRLMAKFDHQVNLPQIFRENGLAILPLSRSNYIIGRFSAYQPVKYNPRIKPIPMSFPHTIESIDPANLYSESAAIHCAYVSGMIDNLLSNHFELTASGRMGTDRFTFHIRESKGNFREIRVENSQTELDAGFESAESFVILEAKNESVEDFLIRQLFYPYRLWISRIRKQVIPVFLTLSNDVFSFFVYRFNCTDEYNSIELLGQQNYIINPEIITRKDILAIVYNIKHYVTEPKVPFPQADSFERVIDLLSILMENDMSKEELTARYQFTERQTDYYSNVAIYLGLVQKYKIPDTGDIMLTLTRLGQDIMGKRYKAKYLSLAQCILEHEVFHKVFVAMLEQDRILERGEVVEIMKQCPIYHVGKEGDTIYRRAGSVISWIRWIKRLANE